MAYRQVFLDICTLLCCKIEWSAEIYETVETPVTYKPQLSTTGETFS